MLPYLEHAYKILTSPDSGYKPNRTGVDSISNFGHQAEYRLSDGFPLMTTKKMPFAAVAKELFWFLRGETNIQPLVRQGVHIWDRNAFQYYLEKQGMKGKLPLYSQAWHEELNTFVERVKHDDDFAAQHGNLGEVYGAQWRHWRTTDGSEIDQIANVIDALKNSQSSRRIILSAWNPEQVPRMALPPCHMIAQFNVLDGKLDCHLTQRSCDMFLGVPFNVASYALLTHILAQESGLEPGRFIHSLGDAHFYCGRGERGRFYKDHLPVLRRSLSKEEPHSYEEAREYIEAHAPREQPGEEGLDHVTGILEQLVRIPGKLPHLEILHRKPFDQLTVEDFKLHGYTPYAPIKRAMAA